MGRLIILIGLVITAVILFRRAPSVTGDKNTNNLEKNQHNSNLEPMLKCQQCGVHTPKSKSISAAEHFFCSEEHKNQFLSNTNKENTS